MLHADIIKSINLFAVPHLFSKKELGGYLRDMSQLGFDVVPIHRGFDAIAREKDSLLIDKERVPQYARRKANFMKKAGSFFESHPVFIMEKKQVRQEMKGIPIIKLQEIKEAESAGDLIELVRKREKV